MIQLTPHLVKMTLESNPIFLRYYQCWICIPPGIIYGPLNFINKKVSITYYDTITMVQRETKTMLLDPNAIPRTKRKHPIPDDIHIQVRRHPKVKISTEPDTSRIKQAPWYHDLIKIASLTYKINQSAKWHHMIYFALLDLTYFDTE